MSSSAMRSSFWVWVWSATTTPSSSASRWASTTTAPAVFASPSPSSSSTSAAGKSTPAAAAEEKTVFDVKLEKCDAAANIKVIKEVRVFTDLGLEEAKDLVEKVPAVVKNGVTKEEWNAIPQKLKQLGAPLLFWNDALSLK